MSRLALVVAFAISAGMPFSLPNGRILAQEIPQRSAANQIGVMKQIDNLIAAVQSLHASFPGHYPGERFLQQLSALRRRAEQEPTWQWADELQTCRRRMLVEANPLLKAGRVLFVKRNTYGSYHYYDDHDNGIVRAGMGGNLCVLSLDDGSVRELAPQLAGGLFDRFDLSFDGRRIVFGYCKAIDQGLRLWQINVDGTGLRQLTYPDGDESPARRAALSPPWLRNDAKAAKDPQGNLTSRRFLTQDFHPCWLPDGGIAFTSTRARQTVLCGHIGLSVPNLHRIEADGSGLRRLSNGTLNELCPSVLNDGRILYNRWEYVFKSLFLVQPLWAVHPDGGRGDEIYGNTIGQPGVFTQGRAVPDRDDLIVAIGACHEQMAAGPVLLIDLKQDRRLPSAMRSITPEVEARGNHHRFFARDGRMVQDNGSGGPVFCDPFPLSDQFFLVSHNPDRPIADKTAYGLYLIDVFGNRVLLHKDPAISCFQPVLLQPRPKPPVLPPTTIRGENAPAQAPQGTLFVQDVYQGLPGVQRGAVKYLRLVEQLPRSWDVLQQSAKDDGGCGSPIVVLNKGTHIWVAVLHGVVPVREDGSAHFTAPAGRNLFLQALDENFMQVQTMRSFINLQPGETRSCVGCHDDRRKSAPHRPAAALALKHPATRPAPQPGDATATRFLHYPTDIQPILDRHCVRCHRPEQLDGKLNLTGELTQFFSKSYEELLDKRHVQGFSEWTSNPDDVAPLPPYSRGAPASKLIALLQKGHYDAKLSQPQFVRLVTWIDLNLPYYGSYLGKRSLQYKSDPDFRPVPTLIGQSPHPARRTSSSSP